MSRFQGYKLDKYQRVYFDHIQEAEEGYFECISFVLSHPRFVLDNLDYLKEFQVPWLSYHSKEYCEKNSRGFAVSSPRNKNIYK